ncbi:MAG: dephospho-CoA kinase [Alphaproteobacteria bacterium]|nr:dephospho-CoA kinase [Alphaproteobacteria bacterium]
MVFQLGLTGGIGSGKSTVAAMLAERGAAIIDADAISRTTTAAGGLAVDAIRQQFGPHFITTEGALDRERMRALVFEDPGARQRLETIVHPLVAQETERQAQAAIDAGHRLLVFDVPLLAESKRWQGRVDKVLVVDCTPETQVRRVVERNGLTPDEVRRIIAAQTSREQRLAIADWVILNDGLTLAELRAQVQALPLP